MRTIASLILSGWALAVPAAWSQTNAADPDPFDGAGALPESAAYPPLLRIQVEYIEIEHEALTALMAGPAARSDTLLRSRLAELVQGEKARVLETQVCVAPSGQKATVESIEEFIYPTEYEPAQLPQEVNLSEGGAAAKLDGRVLAVGPTPTAFETRNLGSTLEIEPRLLDAKGLIELRFAPELVFHVKNERWAEWNGAPGESHIQMPIIYSMRTSTAVILRDGKPRFVAALSPKSEEGHPDYDRKVLIFARGDVVTVE